jgi:hypothetical protein
MGEIVKISLGFYGFFAGSAGFFLPLLLQALRFFSIFKIAV